MGNSPGKALKEEYNRLFGRANPETHKLCRRCLKIKSKLAFARLSASDDGLRYYCRQCARTPVRQVDVTEKECARCHFVQPIAKFGIKKDAKDGHQPYCVHCRTLYNSTTQTAYLKRTEVPLLKERWCQRCKTTKPIEQFHRNLRWSDGYQATCRACLKAYQDQPLVKATMSRTSALREEHPPHTYTEDDKDYAISYRVATINDPCGYCGRTTGKMMWTHIQKQADGGRDEWWNLRRACSSCLRWIKGLDNK